MKHIPLTQGKVAIVDDDKFEWLNQWKWYAYKHISSGYYAIRQQCVGMKNGKRVGKTIYMHRQILNAQKGQITDHKNRSGLDNRRYNLRLCSAIQNSQNRKSIGKTSKYKGVSRYINNKWQVHIKLNNRRINLGYYDNEIDAAKTYNAKARELFGEFAYINNI